MPISFPFHRAAAAALVLAFGLPSWASPPLTLAEALATAVDRSQQIAAQDAVITSAREQGVSAAQLPDPVLKLGVDNLPVNGEDRFSLTNDFMTMRRIGVMQEIPRAEKRQLRAERFERDAQRAQAERQLVLATVQRNTATAWLDRYYTQAMHDLLQRQLEETRLQVQAAETIFGTGRGSQADVFAARAALILLEDRLSQTDRQARGASLMLARWVGTAAERTPSGPPPWQITSLESALSVAHLQHHPDMQVLAAQIETAKTEARLAQANKQADWSVQLMYNQRGPAYSNMISVNLSVPLQWDQKNRQDREVAAKLALLDQARAEREDTVRAHTAEVRAMIAEWENGRERHARYERELLPLVTERTQAALAAYRGAKASVTDVLLARRGEIDVRMQALQLEMDTARLWAQLNFLFPDGDAATQTGVTHTKGPR